MGLASHAEVMAAFPETRRTAIKFKDGSYCGCNLFGFLNPQSYKAAQFWRQVEKERKNPLKMMRILGWWAVTRYLGGTMSLNDALGYLSKQMGLRAGVVMLPFPRITSYNVCYTKLLRSEHGSGLEPLSSGAVFRIGPTRSSIGAAAVAWDRETMI